MDASQAHDECERVLETIGEAIVADRRFFEDILVGVVGRGHVLLEDVPGTGKTLTARNVARALGLSFSRVQFTPDLLPSDVTGTHIYNENDATFEFTEGPIFANIVLADEINRAPPKTQAALLEAMEEGQVTVAGETRELPKPFFVIATQNPVEQEGTFPLPEAQVDRFLVKTSMGYPDEAGEIELLERRASRDAQSPTVERVFEESHVRDLRLAPETIDTDPDLLSYIAAIARQTRTDGRVAVGVSPRGTQRLFEASRAYATLQGREYVTPDDIKRVAQPVLAHRLVLTPDAAVNDVEKSHIVEGVLDSVPVPTIE
ncbi:ATPase [Halovivax asiaticus JCM 14624]|uniref:ATPase n=1 Tax=Halovivax asiaticus JCM 14624 TaxID=1227490 RepID=M0BA44_9EURY|nr:MoxR family ATPase [Halovivax asiaticus]ELZ07776.1 ATPase [Halovivax asiaticus JCM 14624]